MKKILITFILVFSFVLGVGSYGIYRYLHRPKPVIKPVEEQTMRLIEGWTIFEMGDYLEKQGIVSKKEFLKALAETNRSEYPFLNSVPKNSDLEGFLFPDTYRVLKGVSAKEVVQKLLVTFGKKTNNEVKGSYGVQIIPGYENLVIGSSKGLTMYQVVTLASILEKETGIDLTNKDADQKERLFAERRTVAGIFLNRLSINQALESDATINYITGKNKAAPSSKDLEANSLYNTYKYPGLPPGPICNPSLMSIQAVLNPFKTDYYYFLHKQPSGEVVYSKTFEEHVNNKFKYLK